MIGETDYLLLQSIYCHGDRPTAKQIFEQLKNAAAASTVPDCLTDTKNLSSRLCDLRKRGLTQSEPNNNGINLWELTNEGIVAMQGFVNGDQTPNKIPEPPTFEIKPVKKETKPIEKSVEKPVDPNPPFCADVVNESTINIAPEFLIDAMKIQRPVKFNNIGNALFVLRTLQNTVADLPSFHSELQRIADYLEAAA